MRKMLLQVVRDVMDGKDPPGVAFRPEDNQFDGFAVVHATLPNEIPWQDQELVKAHAVQPSPYGY